MNNIEWLLKAELDLLSIYRGIARANPIAAEKVVGHIERRVAILQRHAEIGIRRPDINREARLLIVPPHLILYRIETGALEDSRTVTIVRIIDGRRDLSDLL